LENWLGKVKTLFKITTAPGNIPAIKANEVSNFIIVTKAIALDDLRRLWGKQLDHAAEQVMNNGNVGNGNEI
jgi:hypothetical protein